ncbi:MAG: hypothetical protein WCF19_03085 [Chlamydiales bacterium]
MNHRQILTGCLTLSLLFHAAALLCIHRYSLWFSSPQTGQNNENWFVQVDKKERDHILKSAFEEVREPEETAPLEACPEDLATPALKTPVQIRESERLPPILFQLPLPIQEPLLASPVLPTFSIHSQSFNLLDHLPKDLIVPTPVEPSRPLFIPLQARSFIALSAESPSIDVEAPSTEVIHTEKIDLALTEAPTVGKPPGLIPLPHLPKLPTLAELETSSYSDSFDADLVVLPREEGKGYIFALTLIPRPDLDLPKLNQHITFLIDRSNSIQQGRLLATKTAVHKALGELVPGDTFNIIAFDSKVEKMSPNDLPCMERSYAMAEEFLDKVQLGSFFSSSDLYKPLFLTIPGSAENDQVYTAILLTDGETLAKKSTQRLLLHDWTAYNQGKVSLFAIGLNDPNMAALDAATMFNRGKILNAPTSRGLKRKLLKLMKMIEYPIAKNLVCHAISRSPKSKIKTYPKSVQMPHLYLDQPYVILGETDTLDDFILFIQGRLKGRWLNVKKTISFLQARKGNKSLKQEFAFQRAYEHYEQYMIDEDPKHIADAEALLEPYDFPTAIR